MKLLEVGSVFAQYWLMFDVRQRKATNLADKVFCEVAKIIWPWHVRVTEEVLILVLGVVTIPKEQLEQME